MGRAFGQSRRARREDSGIAILELMLAFPGFFDPLSPSRLFQLSRPQASAVRRQATTGAAGYLLRSASVSRSRARCHAALGRTIQVSAATVLGSGDAEVALEAFLGSSWRCARRHFKRGAVRPTTGVFNSWT